MTEDIAWVAEDFILLQFLKIFFNLSQVTCQLPAYLHAMHNVSRYNYVHFAARKVSLRKHKSAAAYKIEATLITLTCWSEMVIKSHFTIGATSGNRNHVIFL